MIGIPTRGGFSTPFSVPRLQVQADEFVVQTCRVIKLHKAITRPWKWKFLKIWGHLDICLLHLLVWSFFKFGAVQQSRERLLVFVF